MHPYGPTWQVGHWDAEADWRRRAPPPPVLSQAGRRKARWRSLRAREAGVSLVNVAAAAMTGSRVAALRTCANCLELAAVWGLFGGVLTPVGEWPFG